MAIRLFAVLFATLASNPNSKNDGDQEASRDENPNTQSASRLAPLIPALGCPLSSLLEIPALTEHMWTPSQSSPLLFAGLVISVILGFTANISLICRYFEYRPQFSTQVAIGSLTIHDSLNLGILIKFVVGSQGSPHRPFGSIWMLVASTIISVLCNFTLIIDYVRVDNFRAKGSGLTTKQRTLAIVVMCLLLYIGIGAVIFALLESHQITFSDALYFSVCTVTTVGFGDITPTRSVTRVFNFFYAIVGVVLLALTVSTSRDTIIEAFESLVRSRRRAIAHKSKQLYKAATKQTHQEDYDQILSESDTSRHTHSAWFCWPIRKPAHTTSMPSSTDSIDPKASFEKFQQRLLREETKELQSRLFIATFLFSCFWLLGGAVFKFTEGWTYGQALYFGYVAFLTLGYGDFTVESSGGRAFFIAWSLLGIGNMTLLLAVLTQAWEMRYKRAITKSRHRKLALTREATAQLVSVDEVVGSLKYLSGEPEEVDVNQTLDQLLGTAEEFLKHAQYWMNGKTGEVPARLTQMMQEAEKVEGLERAVAKGGLIDKVTSDQRRRGLFLMSFAKSFEILTQQVCQAKAIVQANAEQLVSLQNLIESHESPFPSSSHEHLSGSIGYRDDSPARPYLSREGHVEDIGPLQAAFGFSTDQPSPKSVRSALQRSPIGILTEPHSGQLASNTHFAPTFSTIQPEPTVTFSTPGAEMHTRDNMHRPRMPESCRTSPGSPVPLFARLSIDQSFQTQRLVSSSEAELCSPYPINESILNPPPPLKNKDIAGTRRT